MFWFDVSLWNTSVGPTEGVTFTTMPSTAAITIQAAVESASSIIWLFLLRVLVDQRFLTLFMVGRSIGFSGGLGACTYLPPSDVALQIIMGFFMLLTTWMPLSKIRFETEDGPWNFGLGTSFARLFTRGVAAFVATAVDKKHNNHGIVVAKMMASLTYQHSIKVVIFVSLGFSFTAYADLMIAMFVAAILGTWIGKRVPIDVPKAI